MIENGNSLHKRPVNASEPHRRIHIGALRACRVRPSNQNRTCMINDAKRQIKRAHRVRDVWRGEQGGMEGSRRRGIVGRLAPTLTRVIFQPQWSVKYNFVLRARLGADSEYSSRPQGGLKAHLPGWSVQLAVWDIRVHIARGERVLSIVGSLTANIPQISRNSPSRSPLPNLPFVPLKPSTQPDTTVAPKHTLMHDDKAPALLFCTNFTKSDRAEAADGTALSDDEDT
ncbi:hypothetical protein DFP72DRAFT_1111402 [Ephemerocybe angulata]|uniref:Uncharacterized protein n=1 Tax=Ephemerocybe angulata TaxID=980116 RepID=A0A8H6I2A1_9AGAR|nr:hypothetical protein DFP72DRAFT_1111402 [Tulosesus angulatus]